MGTEAVKVYPNFSLEGILRPPTNFETVYQGANASTPVAMPGTLDDSAGDPGFEATLLAGFPVPFGSRVCIWIPLNISGYMSLARYSYQIGFRLRSSADFREDIDNQRPRRSQFHLRERYEGIPEDPNSPTSTLRYVVPAATQVIAFTQPEPVLDPEINAEIILRGQSVVTAAGLWEAPFLPPGIGNPGDRGVITQGIFPFPTGGGGVPGGPVFNPLWFDAEGDEMFVFVRRRNFEGFTWDFAGLDLELSNTYGTANGTRPANPNVGIYVFTGSNP